MRTAIAETYLRVLVDCPYCDKSCQDILEEVQEDLGSELRCEDMETEITCEDCGETFLVTEVEY